MILLPQGRKIALIAASLFVATFSLVFFVSSAPQGLETSHLKASVFQSFFEHEKSAETPESDVPGIILDGSGHIVSVSDLFNTSFGYDHENLVGTPFFHLVSPDDLAVFAGDYARVVSSGKIAVNEGPYRVIAKDNSSHLVLATFTPSESGERGKVVTLTFKDISGSVQSKQKSEEATSVPSVKNLQNSHGEKNRIIVDRVN